MTKNYQIQVFVMPEYLANQSEPEPIVMYLLTMSGFAMLDSWPLN